MSIAIDYHFHIPMNIRNLREEATENARQFAVWLNERLDRQGWSGSELARRVGVTSQSVARWRRGAALPSDVALQAIARALGVPHEQVMRKAGYDLGTRETKTPYSTMLRVPVVPMQEASAKARELLDSQTVILRDDPTQDTRDTYGRLLMYCWRASDNLFYNLEMIKQGYAHEYTYEIPYQYQAEFKAAQTEAMNAERGLWSPTTCDGDTEQAAPTPEPATPAPTVEPTQAPSTGGVAVIANLNTGVYHYPDCSSVPKIKNPVPMGSPSEAIAAGCRPCKRCNPPTTP